MEGMVSINDYQNFGEGFGLGSAQDLFELTKALDTGGWSQAGGVESRVGGASLIVESLENSLKVLTYSDKHVKFWKKIYKMPAYSTVEEYNQLLSYGSEGGGFVPEGMLPDTEDSTYKRKASFVKFLGTTRQVTHPMTLVRTAHGDVIARENQNGILWLMKKIEHGLFWGNSSLAPGGAEGYQFDGLNQLIDAANSYDCAGKDLTDRDINFGAQLILQNFGTPTDLFMPFETLAKFSETFFPKERVIMPNQGTGYRAGLVVNKFQTHGGEVEFEPNLFLQKTKPVPSSATGGSYSPTPPASIAAAAMTGTNGDFAKSGVGTYRYQVTAVNRHGESLPTAAATVVIGTADVTRHVPLTITNGTIVNAPDFFRVYRTEANGTVAYCIAEIPAGSVNSGGTTTWTDRNLTMPNTYTAFMGEFTPDVICFKQLAPIMKMDLAVLSPAYRWMILLYGVPQLFAPRKWMKFVNIKAENAFGTLIT